MTTDSKKPTYAEAYAAILSGIAVDTGKPRCDLEGGVDYQPKEVHAQAQARAASGESE